MKQYTMSQFKKDGYTIPNLPDYIKIEIEEEGTWRGKLTKFRVNVEWFNNNFDDFELPADNEWYTFLSFWADDAVYNDSIKEIAIRLDYINRRTYESGRSILDGLYYKYNPMEYRFKNGTLKSGFWSNLKQRLHGRAKYSTATEAMFDYGWNEYKENRLRINPEYTLDSIKTGYELLLGQALEFCGVTSKVYPYTLLKHIKIENDYKQVYFKLKPEDVGMVYVRGQQTDWWKQPDQILHNDRVYDPEDLVFRTCPVCNQGQIESEFVGDLCKPCNDTKYQIHSYSTRVPNLLKFKASNVKPGKDPLYFGIELEYETTNKEAAKKATIDLLHGHAILKSDGSIRDGFEIVTCPATADIHLEVFKHFYDNMPSQLKTASNVGMHIHISRKPLNLFTIGKMTEFLNKVENKPLIKLIAGRIDNSYCRMEGRTVTFPLIGRGERYNALNLNPTETIEIRIFSTPNNFDQFASRLQFAQALVDYCGPAQVNCSLKDLTKQTTFTNWVLQHRKDYPQLSMLLKGAV